MFTTQAHLGRRNFLIGLGSLVSAGSIVVTDAFQQSEVEAKVIDPMQRDFSIATSQDLRLRAAEKGLYYGAFPSVGKAGLDGPYDFRNAFVRECELIVGGVYWQSIEPDRYRYDFSQVDFFAQFSREHNLLFRGHPLVWHNLLPDWLNQKFSEPLINSDEIETILTHHISSVVSRYAGQVHSWDVVNEVISLEDEQFSGLRQSPWYKVLGARYIDIAFWAARAADPEALLVLNGDLLEHDTPEADARRQATLNLLFDLKSRNIPVQALGMQSHLSSDQPFNFGKLRQFLKDVADLDLKILITELDVKDQHLTADINTRDLIVASIYEDFLSTVLDEPAVIGVSTWGLSDRHTWLTDIAPRDDGFPLRPLPLDENMNRKLAWNAIARALDACPERDA
jgi:endo-1,4-beta-xylanase